MLQAGLTTKTNDGFVILECAARMSRRACMLKLSCPPNGDARAHAPAARRHCMAEHTEEMASKLQQLLYSHWSACSSHEWLFKFQGAFGLLAGMPGG